MRDLEVHEVNCVSGGGDALTGYEGEPTGDLTGCGGKQKNNNGYGNGAEAGLSPGHSFGHNPQLLDWNQGHRGER